MMVKRNMQPELEAMKMLASLNEKVAAEAADDLDAAADAADAAGGGGDDDDFEAQLARALELAEGGERGGVQHRHRPRRHRREGGGGGGGRAPDGARALDAARGGAPATGRR